VDVGERQFSIGVYELAGKRDGITAARPAVRSHESGHAPVGMLTAPLLPGTGTTSESTQRLVDEEVRRMIDTARQEVTSLLTEYREQLESLAQALLVSETLDGLDAYAAAGVPVSRQQPAEVSSATNGSLS
jgi:hypothetical protein